VFDRLAMLVLLCVPTAGPNELLSRLTDEGVPMPSGAALRLPAPTMADGLTAEQQRAAVATVADANRPLDELLRRSVVAPFVLKTGVAESGGTRRRVDLWFVAYGDFAKITDEDFLKDRAKVLQPPKRQDGDLPSTSKLIDADELRTRGIKPSDDPDSGEGYAYTSFPLFDRVLLSMTTQVMRTTTEESVTLASLLDPRFNDDATYPVFWQSLARDEAGRMTLGEKRPFVGWGSYLKITKMAEPAGALFVEYHAAFDEPAGWFNGANLLRSKLPLVVQDAIRKLRRELNE
jgi:hypothetical protein